ncbi:PREDICTED: uncharacterized protein LOC104801040 [Tarenaya hassleriana]|uniref:uncharacterized protein LOC104801040 n=1 Tax=Tarenaya hassleriana TaxID=28532 RepID=UPI00053C7307|nr:PREDICTED: uncharacterized protein LOC104801040 [Tarenaya hassleriana]
MRTSRPNRPLNGVHCHMMEEMDIEMVPDTPDRVSRRGSLGGEGGRRENAAREFRLIDKEYCSCLSGKDRPVPGVGNPNRHHSEESRKNCDMQTENRNGTHASRNAPLFRRTTMEKDKGKSICCNFSTTSSASMQKNQVLNINQRNGCTIDVSNDPRHRKEDHVSPSTQPIIRASGRRRLVRNGCISPHVIAARARQAVEHQTSSNGDISDRSGEEKTASDDLSSVDIREIVADDDIRGRAKGKKAIGHRQTSKENAAKALDLPTGINGDIAGGSEGWRSTRNRQMTMGCSHSSVVHDNGRHHQNNCKGENDSRRSFRFASRVKQHEIIEVEREGNKRRRRNVLPYEKEISIVGTPGEASSSRPARIQRQGTQNLVLEIEDDSSSEMRFSNHQGTGRVVENDESGGERARQIEADERLALELQEQLYQESRFFGDEEINESLAWMLQEEENLVHDSSSRNLPIPSVARGRSRLRAIFQQSSSSRGPNILQPRASVRTTRARGYRSDPPPAALSRALNLRFPNGMALDSRLDILEEIEAAISRLGTSMNSAMLQRLDRDFNEDDYEMLLSLDENNHTNRRAGASANLIDSLPQSTVQTDNYGETCAICLETPTTGDVIRHLPCFHKFHRDCIDPWLGRSKLCPVCKSSVT